MHDLHWIRENAVAFDAGLARRGVEPVATRILEQDTERRTVQTALQDLQARRNTLSKDIGTVKREGGDAADLMAEVEQIKARMQKLEEQDRTLGADLKTVLGALPNLLDAEVPDGVDENDNVVVRTYMEPTEIPDAKDHVDLGEALGLMDFETAAYLSGSRFVVLKGALARLERAIGQFMLDTQTNQGYTEVSAPLLVRDDAAYGTGNLPKFADDLFKTTTGHWLIPTPEMTLTNLVAGKILDVEALPLRFTTLSPAFRSEAGSAGRDTRGMIRQHQFWKVEMVAVTAPDQSELEHQRMVTSAERVLKKLGLPFRTIILCSGDNTTFSSQKTYDIEVWMPGQGKYREISSVSNCGAFQARRMNARCRPKGEKKTQFVHTLNGTGVAVGRALVAILENYQQPDGSILIPEALHPYMNGMTVIGAES